MKQIQSDFNADLKRVRDNLIIVTQQIEELMVRYSGTEFKPSGMVSSQEKGDSIRKIGENRATFLERVYRSIKRSKNGASIAQLRKNTKLEPRQISNALYKLSTQNKIKAVKRGHYDIVK